MSISINPSKLTFQKAGGTLTVAVASSNTSWSIEGSCSWCTATKVSNTQARFKATANTGSARTYAFVIMYGSTVVSVQIEQDGTPVSYNRSSLITPYKQITNQSCAATCAGMCVRHSPQELKDAGFDIDYVQSWSAIGTKYGYSTTGPTNMSGDLSSRLYVLYRNLASGYPIIVKINDTNDHWVVVTQYSGSSLTSLMTANNFTCVDPWDGLSKLLPNATRYAGVYRYVIYKKI